MATKEKLIRVRDALNIVPRDIREDAKARRAWLAARLAVLVSEGFAAKIVGKHLEAVAIPALGTPLRVVLL